MLIDRVLKVRTRASAVYTAEAAEHRAECKGRVESGHEHLTNVFITC